MKYGKKVILMTIHSFAINVGEFIDENLIKIPFHFRYNTRALFTSQFEIILKSKVRLIRTLTDPLHFLVSANLFLFRCCS